MAIPVSQLEVWTNQPSSAMASSTYASICTALESDKSRIKGRDVEIFLQGSYKNDTNIRGDSDIDVVVQLNNSFIHDISRLSATEQYLFNESMSDATYTWATFRADVLATLIAYYGVSNVLPDNKCIKIEKGNGRLAADVIPCLQYRSYRHFFDISHQSYIEGICFWAQKDGRTIINYPKEHYNNGVLKNGDNMSGGMYKPSVRMIKNARAHLYRNGVISKDVSPSYFVECLLFNLPRAVFDSRLDHLYCNIVNHLDACDYNEITKYMCQNMQMVLFGNTPEQWAIDKEQILVAELIKLWNDWQG